MQTVLLIEPVVPEKRKDGMEYFGVNWREKVREEGMAPKAQCTRASLTEMEDGDWGENFNTFV